MEAESRILKQSSEQRKRQFSEPLKCLNIYVGMFVGGEMFTDASGEVSIGYYYILLNILLYITHILLKSILHVSWLVSLVYFHRN